MVFFILWIVTFNLMFTQLGAMFDDGGNFSSDYNEDFNDYPYVT